MDKIEYDITLRTALGLRAGKLILNRDGETLKGTLDLLGNRTPVTGKITQNGNCMINGVMKTLLNSFPFTGDGVADRQNISLKLHSGRNNFTLRGTIKERKKTDA